MWLFEFSFIFSPEGREPLADREGESTLLSQSGEEKGSDEVVPGTSMFPLSESGISRNFWGPIKGAKYRFALQDGTWDFSWDAVGGKGLILRETKNPVR